MSELIDRQKLLKDFNVIVAEHYEGHSGVLGKVYDTIGNQPVAEDVKTGGLTGLDETVIAQIEALVDAPESYANNANDMAVTLGEIRGVLDLRNAMREVLRGK